MFLNRGSNTVANRFKYFVDLLESASLFLISWSSFVLNLIAAGVSPSSLILADSNNAKTPEYEAERVRNRCLLHLVIRSANGCSNLTTISVTSHWSSLGVSGDISYLLIFSSTLGCFMAEMTFDCIRIIVFAIRTFVSHLAFQYSSGRSGRVRGRRRGSSGPGWSFCSLFFFIWRLCSASSTSHSTDPLPKRLVKRRIATIASATTSTRFDTVIDRLVARMADTADDVLDPLASLKRLD